MTAPTRDDILAAFPLAEAMEKDGVKLIGSGNAKMALCMFHKEHTPSLSVNLEKNLWWCFGCNVGGSVIDYLALRQGKPAEEVLKELSQQLARTGPRFSANGRSVGKVVATYVYRSATGNPLYQVLRYEPKDFRQQKWTGKDWAWGMEGVQRVLYNLPEVLAAGEKPVVIVEGEKDADNLTKLGWISTTNVGGAGKWMDGYSEALKGRAVVVCGDNAHMTAKGLNTTGPEHVATLIEALDGKCASLRHVVVPAPHKDITEYLALFGSIDAKKQAFDELFVKAAVMVAGSTLPIRSISELEGSYRDSQKESDQQTYSFKGWLPTFGFRIRPCLPGDVICWVAGTATGKTAALQNMALWSGVPTLFFQQELSGNLTFERFVALAMGMPQEDVEAAYRSGQEPDWRETDLSKIFVSTVPGLTVQTMETLINRSELKIGVRPTLVIVDYVQLMKGIGKSRYEMMSSIASDIKSVAISTNTVIAIASQVMRKENPEIGLTDAKDSGSLENSSAIHLGMWRDKDDPSLLTIRVNKHTRGSSGWRIKCNFDGPTLRITERSPVQDA